MNTAPTVETDNSLSATVKRGAAPAAVLLASLLPVLLQFALHGYSSGHDLPFHLGSWQDAAQQLRHCTYPQWDFSAALGAGEPRFIFYPPVSWLLGAALSSFLTPAHASETFILLALAASWLTMFAIARRYTSEAAADLAAAVYIVGPYTLFTALERSAFGELLACAWLPLLFAAVVPASNDERLPPARRIAIPLALLWLTNVPTAIIGSYLLVLLGIVRLIRLRRKSGGAASLAFSLRMAAAATLGLLLCSFFLVPALHQSHFVQLNSAFSEGQNYADNFLLHHTAHTRRGNLHVVSLIAAEYLLPLASLLAILVARYSKQHRDAAPPGPATQASFAVRPRSGLSDQGSRSDNGLDDHTNALAPALLASAAAAILLLFPISSLVWKYLPELSVLQFPWRLLSVLSLVTSLSLALVLAPYLRGRMLPIAAVIALAWVVGGLGAHRYWLNPNRLEVDGRLRRDDAYDEQRRPTVEYTPAGASNDLLYKESTQAANESPYWIVPSATAMIPSVTIVKQAEALVRQRSEPQRYGIPGGSTRFLVSKTRNYPSWTIKVDGNTVKSLRRADGRIAIALPVGENGVDLRWHRGLDIWLGLCLSAGALSYGAFELLSKEGSIRAATLKQRLPSDCDTSR